MTTAREIQEILARLEAGPGAIDWAAAYPKLREMIVACQRDDDWVLWLVGRVGAARPPVWAARAAAAAADVAEDAAAAAAARAERRMPQRR